MRFIYNDGGLHRAFRVTRFIYNDRGLYRAFRGMRFIYNDGGQYRAFRVMRFIYNDGGLYRAFRMTRSIYNDRGLYRACRGMRFIYNDGGLYGAFRVMKFIYNDGGLYRALMYQSIPSLTIPPGNPRGFSRSSCPRGVGFSLPCLALGSARGVLNQSKSSIILEKSAVLAMSLKQLSSSTFHMFIYAGSEQCDLVPIYKYTAYQNLSR